jgi:hypothetical protein
MPQTLIRNAIIQNEPEYAGALNSWLEENVSSPRAGNAPPIQRRKRDIFVEITINSNFSPVWGGIFRSYRSLKTDLHLVLQGYGAKALFPIITGVSVSSCIRVLATRITLVID